MWPHLGHRTVDSIQIPIVGNSSNEDSPLVHYVSDVGKSLPELLVVKVLEDMADNYYVVGMADRQVKDISH